jgi:hypothetical protein
MKPALHILIGCLAVLSALTATEKSTAQTVCIGSDKECKEEQERLCREEPAPANLIVSKQQRIRGVLLDESGAVFVFENTFVQLRDAKTRQVLRQVLANPKGEFELGVVTGGSYRLVAVHRRRDGVLTRLPLTEQPGLMTCSGDEDCKITAVQKIHGTDNPIDSCPPK